MNGEHDHGPAPAEPLGAHDPRPAPAELLGAHDPVPAPADPLGALLPMAFSAVLHVGLLVASALAMPPLGAEATPGAADTWIHTFHARFSPDAEPEEDELAAETVADTDPDGKLRVDSRCGELHGGTMGEPTAPRTSHHYGVAGPVDNADPHIAREASTSSAWIESTIGLVRPNAGAYSDPDTPTIPWGRDDALGTDPASARGEMWGDDLGQSLGSPGASIGLPRICPTCGAYGRGGRSWDRTTAGGATGTEEAPHGVGIDVI